MKMIQCKVSVAQDCHALAVKAGPRSDVLRTISSLAGSKLRFKNTPATSRRAYAGRISASAESSKGMSFIALMSLMSN